MEERIDGLVEELKAQGKSVFVIVIDDKNTYSRSFTKDDRDLLRAVSAIGRACARCAKRLKH